MTRRTTDIPAPPWRTGKRPVRQPLSQDAIVAAALRLLDAEGLDAVSMRRVAQDLGTGPASLYAHVANKDELIELVLDEVLGEVVDEAERVAAASDLDWRDAVRTVTRTSRRAMQRHRDIARAAMVGVPLGPNGLRVSEAYLGILTGAGLPDQIVAWGVDRLSLYVTADVLEGAFYRNRGFRNESDARRYWTQVGDYLRSLPPDRFPHTVRMVDAMMTGDSDERFEHGLDMILDGLARHLP
ncbi:TetR/AcrR family transcriptional regulator [Actinocatenispora rupis]|uniref:TetR/AcrR family transcriptional regulator n=1 Tax=Actinocatenispora rupis TaxID=519421 RepID=UPI0019443BB1|nr:TetR/AcrR family transcriptional regulator [Actinocatenispora rupis]